MTRIPVTTKKPPNPQPDDRQNHIPTNAEDWIRQFVKHLEAHFLDAAGDLRTDASDSEVRQTAAKAVIASFLDSGVDHDTLMELFGQAVLENTSADFVWNDELNRRRFELIDKEIQGSLSPPEKVELAGLTRIMRSFVDSEANLPMQQARALHQKLLQVKSRGKAD